METDFISHHGEGTKVGSKFNDITEQSSEHLHTKN